MHCVACNAGFCFLSGKFDRTEACVSWVLCSQSKDCGRDGENWMGKVSCCFFPFLLLYSSFIVILWHLYIWLSAKRYANGGLDFWLSIKSVSNTLSCCCFVCVFIIGQYHSGNNMSSKSGTAGEILFFESEKRHEIRPLKMDTLTVSTFDAFIHIHDASKHYLRHQFAQRRYV